MIELCGILFSIALMEASDRWHRAGRSISSWWHAGDRYDCHECARLRRELLNAEQDKAAGKTLFGVMRRDLADAHAQLAAKRERRNWS